jgi:photosynthetic reaction center cytochrome c subunit
MRVTKVLLGTFLAGVVLELGVAGLCAQSMKPSTSGSTPHKAAEQVYKNIQVLKGVPADQLIPAMQFITASLGVQCDFCHLESAFEKDDKETKQTARKMMRMMFAINNENFDGHREVTCYACHRGAHKPVITPTLNEAEGELVPEDKMHHGEASTAGLPSADQILGKYLLAVGGADAAARLSTRIQKGTLTVGSQPFPVEILAKAPDKRITTVHFPGGDSVTGVNGQEGWLSTPGRALHEMSPPELDAAMMDVELFFPASLKQTSRELRVEGPEQIKGRETYVLSGTRGSLATVRLYFDQESGLLVRALHFMETPLGRNPTEIDYADYRQRGGLKTPFRWTVARSNGRVTIQIEQTEQNVPIDDDKFMKPAVPASTQSQLGPS